VQLIVDVNCRVIDELCSVLMVEPRCDAGPGRHQRASINCGEWPVQHLPRQTTAACAIPPMVALVQ